MILTAGILFLAVIRLALTASGFFFCLPIYYNRFQFLVGDIRYLGSIGLVYGLDRILCNTHLSLQAVRRVRLLKSYGAQIQIIISSNKLLPDAT